jgi:hypothetical protein
MTGDSPSQPSIECPNSDLSIAWLTGLAEKGGKGVVGNIDARSLGRIAGELEDWKSSHASLKAALAALQPTAEPVRRCKHDVSEDCPACAEETIAGLKTELAEWKQAASVDAGLRREFSARVEELEAALRIFVPPGNGPMEDALWGNQPDDALMTIRIKFGEYKKGRAALHSSTPAVSR